MKTVLNDLTSLSDHASFLSTKVNFLLDATLGLINIEQNGIIKIVSVAAVVFLPPTLVASVYGMNFDVMPELKWVLGYLGLRGVDGQSGRKQADAMDAARSPSTVADPDARAQ